MVRPLLELETALEEYTMLELEAMLDEDIALLPGISELEEETFALLESGSLEDEETALLLDSMKRLDELSSEAADVPESPQERRPIVANRQKKRAFFLKFIRSSQRKP